MRIYDEAMEQAAVEEEVDVDAYDADEEVQKHQGIKDSLMREANSVEHQITHFPKNPYCMACQWGKMQQSMGKRKGTASLGQKPEAFGDQCTADHIAKTAEHHFGINDERVALVITDRASGFL